MALVLFLVLGAAAPQPILRNQWTTNFPGQQIKGTTFFDSAIAIGSTMILDPVTMNISFNNSSYGDLGIVANGLPMTIGDSTFNGNITASGWSKQTGTGHTNISTVLGRAPLTLFGSTNGFFFPTNAADGKVWTSDAVGNGRWITSAASGLSGSLLSTNLAVYTDGSTNLISAVISNLTWASTVDINFNVGPYQYLIMTNDTTFTGSRLGAAKAVAVKIFAGSTNYNLVFPSWTFIGSSAPSVLASNKTAVLSLTAFDVNTTNVIAAWAVQP